MDETGGRGAPVPRSLDELWALRSDFEDVAVPELSGVTLRVYALSGSARALLVPDMAAVAASRDDSSPETVRAVFDFQTRVVASSLGYSPEDWEAVGRVLGSAAIERLYEVASRLSGLDHAEQAKASRRLRPVRSAASGSD